MSENCIFCKIIKGDIPSFKLYEDEETIAFMDINPVNPGHCLVVPKEHAENLFDISAQALAAGIKTTQKIAAAVEKAVKPDGLNILQANGKGAAQSVLHLHFHIIPRILEDNLLMNWGLNPGNKDEIAQIVEKIKAVLS